MSKENIFNYFKDSTIRLNLGSLLIGWLIELKLLKNKLKRISKTEKHNILIAVSKLEDFLPKDNIPFLHIPNKISMKIQPKTF